MNWGLEDLWVLGALGFASLGFGAFGMRVQG